MSTAVQLRRGTTAEHASFTGLVGETTVDTTKDTLVVHDGVAAGGHPLAKESALADKLDKSGGTMTGALTLSGAPSNSLHAATKAYVDGIVAAQDAMVFKGVIDCSANPNYPAADRGWTYRVSVAGKIGGGSGPNVEVGDIIICQTDSTASGNHATVGSAWGIIQVNIDGAVTTANLPASTAAAIHAASAETTLDGADEFGFWDSVATAFRRITFTNVLASIWAGLGALIAGGTNKATVVDADNFALADSAASNAPKRVTATQLWTNYLKSKADALYQGANTLLASIAALSVVTGDLIYGSGTGAVSRRGIGTSGQVLTVSGGLPTWADAPGGGWDMSGQSWQDVSGSRNANNTAYQNTTGKPIMVYMTITYAGTGQVGPQVSPNNSTWWPVVGGGAGSTTATLTFIVPPGYYYRTYQGSSGSKITWNEFR